jgi:hypothetical protein
VLFALQMEPQHDRDLDFQTRVCSDGDRHNVEIHPPPVNPDNFSTPKKRATSGPFCVSIIIFKFSFKIL